MNILILNWRDIKHPLSGGAEISLFEQAKVWQSKGANISWFSSSFAKASSEEIIDGIKIIRRGNHHTVHIWGFIYFLLRKLDRPDIIIDSFHFIPFFSPLYFRSAKVIALINEPAKNAWFKNIMFPLSLIGFLIEPLFFIFYKNKQFITGSESIAKELQEYGIKKKNINVVHHGLNIKKIEMSKREKEPLILFMAQLTQDKGIEDAIKAFSILRKKDKDIKFYVLGKAVDKNYLSKLKKLSSDLKLGNAIRFMGYVTEDRKNELISKSWVLVHPSIREGWGLNVIECNAYGVPSVGYDVVGLRDSIQNEKTGLLVNNNPESLSEGVEKLILNKKLYDQMSKEARLWAGNFDWSKSGEKSWKVIERTI